MIRVKEIMSRNVVSLMRTNLVMDAIYTMSSHRIRHLPIVDKRMRIQGLVTQRDLLAFRGDRASTLESIMKKTLVYVDPESSLLKAATLMRKHKYGCVPVVSDSRLVGILTGKDFLDIAIKYIEQADINDANERNRALAPEHVY